MLTKYFKGLLLNARLQNTIFMNIEFMYNSQNIHKKYVIRKKISNFYKLYFL